MKKVQLNPNLEQDYKFVKFNKLYNVVSESLNWYKIKGEHGIIAEYYKNRFIEVDSTKNVLTSNEKYDKVEEKKKGNNMKVRLRNDIPTHFVQMKKDYPGEYELLKEMDTVYFIRGPKGRFMKVHKDYFMTIDRSSEGDVWEVQVDIIKSCSKAPEKIKVVVFPLANLKIKELMKMFPNIEWLAYIIGEKTNNHFTVKDLLIPKQHVTAGSVDNIDYSVPNGTPVIGVIHSHHSMGAGFSHTDAEWINKNHDLSIVVSHNAMKAMVRWKTPCGGFLVKDAEIVFDYGIEWDTEAFKNEVDEKIKNRHYNHSVVPETHRMKYWKKDLNQIIPEPLRGCNTLEDEMKSEHLLNQF